MGVIYLVVGVGFVNNGLRCIENGEFRFGIKKKNLGIRWFYVVVLVEFWFMVEF